ncbi:MAG TPA: hypothetical protein VNE62_03190, partial [Actinomycetota bacterium]|nr:hypothetical protein [Actinomycetota bacterium]
LSPLTEAGEVRTTVAKALSVPLDQSAALAEYIGRGRLLLILDNCEHVVAEAASLADELVRSCPSLVILATSRELLGVDGETPWRVPSLTLPGDEPPSDLDRFESVRLFVDRAARARGTFDLTDETGAAVATICRRVDGIPLAIELAAARTKVLTPKQISEGLTDCFRLLAGGSRTLMPRQQTLRASVDWSYRLLDPAEQTLLRRMSVFVGGCTLDAAEAVCAQGDVEAFEVLDLLTRLLDKSLVVVEEKAGKARYRLLETIRRFAAEKLADSGEAEQVLAKSRDYWRRFVDRPMEDWYAASGFDLLIEVDAEWQNISAAVEDLQSLGKAREASQIAIPLVHHALARGRVRLVTDWLRSAADRLTSQDVLQSARCLAARVFVLSWSVPELSEDINEVRALAEEAALDDQTKAFLLMAEALDSRFSDPNHSLDVSQQLLDLCPEDSVLAGAIWGVRAFASLSLGRVEDAKAEVLADLEHHRSRGRLVGEGSSSFRAGMLLAGIGELVEARKHYEHAIPLLDRLEYKVYVQWAMDHLSNVCIALGDTDAALVWAERGIELSRSRGITGGSNYPFLLLSVAGLSERSGQYERGLAAALEAVETSAEKYHVAQALTWAGLLAQRARDPRACGLFVDALLVARHLQVTTDLRSGSTQVPALAGALGGLARAAAAEVRHERCARLSGAAEARREFEEQAAGGPVRNVSRELRQDWVESCLAPAKEALGPRWEVEFQRGRELAKDDAVAYALEEESTEVVRTLIEQDRAAL